METRNSEPFTWKRKKLGHISYGITFGWVAPSRAFSWEYRIYRNPITHRYDIWIFGPEDGWADMEMDGISNPLMVVTGVKSADRAKYVVGIVEEAMVSLWRQNRKEML